MSSLEIRRIHSLPEMIPAAVCPLIVFPLAGLVFRESGGRELGEVVAGLAALHPHPLPPQPQQQASRGASRSGCHDPANEAVMRAGSGVGATACIFIRKAHPSPASGCRCLLKSKSCDLTLRLLIKQAMGVERKFRMRTFHRLISRNAFVCASA